MTKLKTEKRAAKVGDSEAAYHSEYNVLEAVK